MQKIPRGCHSCDYNYNIGCVSAIWVHIYEKQRTPVIAFIFWTPTILKTTGMCDAVFTNGGYYWTENGCLLGPAQSHVPPKPTDHSRNLGFARRDIYHNQHKRRKGHRKSRTGRGLWVIDVCYNRREPSLNFELELPDLKINSSR